MKRALLLSLLAISGCANVSTTRFTFVDPKGSKVIVEMPKEIEASDLKVFINAIEGSARIEASEWSSKNVDGIKAQGERESAITENAVKGAVEGAIDGMKGMP
jgi:hypothetical protein